MMFRAVMLGLTAGLCALTSGEAANVPQMQYVRQRESLPLVRVLVAHDVPNAMIEVHGNYILTDPYQGDVVSRRIYGKQRLIEPLPGGLKWGEVFPNLFQIKITPGSPESSVTVNGLNYRGNIYVYDIGGTISIVNEVPIEEYVMGLLTAQIDEPLPDEALAAIAIAARSNAFYQATHSPNPYWDVDARAVGYSGEHLSTHGKTTEQAVTGTRYMVLAQQRMGETNVILPLQWSRTEASGSHGELVLSVPTAVQLAERGAHAAQILQTQFPATIIQRICD